MFIIGVGRRLLLSIYIHNKILSSNLVLLVVTFRLETTVSFSPLWAAHQPRQHNNLNSALSLSPVTIFIIDNHFIFNISLCLYVSLKISLGWMFAISETLTDIYHSGAVEVVWCVWLSSRYRFYLIRAVLGTKSVISTFIGLLFRIVMVNSIAAKNL